METEAVLLQRFARTGDAEAFGEIIRRHAGLVYGAAWRVLSDMDRASDVAQETFLQLTKDAAKVTGSLPGWLHRVATRKAIDLVRRDTSRKQRETQYATQQPQRVTAWREISPHVDEGLSALEPELREILVAHFLEGQTTRQIAAVRGISQATVSRRLEAGVTTLRRRLRKRGLLVGAAALSLLLREKTVSAAPAALKMELGKMAIAGGHAPVLAGLGSSGVGAGLRAVVEGVWAGGKAKAVAAMIAATVGIGSLVTYRLAAEPVVPPADPDGVARVAASVWQPSEVAGPVDDSDGWNRIIGAAVGSPVVANQRSVVEGLVPPAYLQDTAAPMKAVAMAGAEGDYCGSHFRPRVPGPNDANDPNETAAQAD